MEQEHAHEHILKEKDFTMLSTYKNVIRARAIKYTEKMWEVCKLKPNFKLRELVEYFGGRIYPDMDDRLADYEEAEIFETEEQTNFEIIYKLRCELTDEEKQILKYSRESDENQKNKRDALIDKHLENKFIRHAVAHEIGHLFLHMINLNEKEEYVIVGEYKRNIKDGSLIEWEAEEFAALLLMPENTFRFYYEKLELIMHDEEERINEMVNKFGVSRSEIIKRGRDLNIW